MLTALIVCCIICVEARESRPESTDILAVLPRTSITKTQRQEVDMTEKECTSCKETKPIDKFHRHAGHTDGRTSTCADCNNKKSVEIRRQRPPEYNVWVAFRRRCCDPNTKGYSNYGGRGIKVCPEWESFEQFLSDMGPRPTPKHQIDRIDNDGDYEPKNCRWVTSATNNQNRRNNKLTMLKAQAIRFQHNFGMVPQKDLAEMYGVGRAVISEIINNKLWSVA